MPVWVVSIVCFSLGLSYRETTVTRVRPPRPSFSPGDLVVIDVRRSVTGYFSDADIEGVHVSGYGLVIEDAFWSGTSDNAMVRCLFSDGSVMLVYRWSADVVARAETFA